jgi:hypothetical protein
VSELDAAFSCARAAVEALTPTAWGAEAACAKTVLVQAAMATAAKKRNSEVFMRAFI